MNTVILPPNISQSQIFGIPLGSNACTIIAVIGAKKFLSGHQQLPTSQNIKEAISSFANTIMDGNSHYFNLNLPPNQTNLETKKALETRNYHFGLQILEDTGIFSPECLKQKFEEIIARQRDQSVIMIAPPDKSMLLCFSSQEHRIGLFESHTHGNRGGIIATANYGHVDNFIHYLCHMCERDWNTNISGSNVAILVKP